GADARRAHAPPADADAGQDDADRVERLLDLGADVLDVAGDQEDADEADRDVDDEDPVPGEVGGDEAAERRPEQRTDEGRHSQPGHGIDQPAPVDAAHQHQAAAPRHPGAAPSLR